MKQLPALSAAAALCFAISVAFSASALAQEDVLRPNIPVPIVYGFELGGNYNMFSQDIGRPFPLDDSPFNAYAEGQGISWFGYLFADYSFQKGMGVQLKLGVDQKSVGNSFTGIGDCRVIRPGGSIDYRTVDMSVDYDVRTTYLTFGTHFRLDLGPSAFATLGPTLHVRLDSTYQRERQTMITDGPCQFLDKPGNALGKEIESVTYIQSEPTARIGVEGAIGYRFPVSPDLTISPVVRYQLMLTEFLEDRPSQDQHRRDTYKDSFPPYGLIPINLSNTSLNSFQLGVNVTFRP